MFLDNWIIEVCPDSLPGSNSLWFIFLLSDITLSRPFHFTPSRQQDYSKREILFLFWLNLQMVCRYLFDLFGDICWIILVRRFGGTALFADFVNEQQFTLALQTCLKHVLGQTADLMFVNFSPKELFGKFVWKTFVDQKEDFESYSPKNVFLACLYGMPNKLVFFPC